MDLFSSELRRRSLPSSGVLTLRLEVVLNRLIVSHSVFWGPQERQKIFYVSGLYSLLY